MPELAELGRIKHYKGRTLSDRRVRICWSIGKWPALPLARGAFSSCAATNRVGGPRAVAVGVQAIKPLRARPQVCAAGNVRKAATRALPGARS